MIEQLLLHQQTKSNVAQFLDSPTHAVVLVGSHGIGKTCLAQAILGQVLNVATDKLEQYPYYTVIRSEKDSISIEAIRSLQRFLHLKTLGNQPLRRGIIIEHADRLTSEAQNAFLKLLEEPPEDTVMILTVDTVQALLPTIRSRVQLISVHAPNEQDTLAHFNALCDDAAAVTQAYFLSGGLPGLMQAFLADDQTHPLLAAVATAKEILQKQLFERLLLVESLSKQKDETKYVVEALQHIARTGLNQAATQKNTAKLKQWHRILKAATEAGKALAQSANSKLVLDNLMLRI